jgi:hypothetical protein
MLCFKNILLYLSLMINYIYHLISVRGCERQSLPTAYIDTEKILHLGSYIFAGMPAPPPLNNGQNYGDQEFRYLEVSLHYLTV